VGFNIMLVLFENAYSRTFLGFCFFLGGLNMMGVNISNLSSLYQSASDALFAGIIFMQIGSVVWEE